MRTDTRQVVRYHVLELQGDTLQMARIGTTLTSDISRSGLFLSHTQLEPGLRVHFYFELPDGYLEAVGKVVHNQRRIDGSLRGYARLRSLLLCVWGRSSLHAVERHFFAGARGDGALGAPRQAPFYPISAQMS